MGQLSKLLGSAKKKVPAKKVSRAGSGDLAQPLKSESFLPEAASICNKEAFAPVKGRG